MLQVLHEGLVTVLEDQGKGEMVLLWNPDATPVQEIVKTHALAATFGYSYVSDDWFDVTNHLHVSLLRKEDHQ